MAERLKATRHKGVAIAMASVSTDTLRDHVTRTGTDGKFRAKCERELRKRGATW